MAPKRRLRLWAVALWLVIWQGASMALDQPLLLPSPLSALGRLAELAVRGAFWQAVAWSTVRILGGFVLACVLGVALAAPAARWRRVREALAPLVTAVKAVPVASFIILALIWLNSRSLPLFIACLTVFPGVYLGVLAGAEQADRQLLELAAVYRVPWPARLRRIYLPAVLPQFRAAASLGLGLCWKAGVAAEVIGLPAGSLGERLYTAKVYFLTADLFAWTAVIVALSAGFERLFLWALDTLGRKEGAL